MKRFTLKLVLAIFTALGLFALYLLACFPLLNTTVFRWDKDKGGGQDSGSQVSGNTTDGANSSGSKNDIFTFNFEYPVNPEISDYIIVNITAKNTGLAKYPYGSIAINLSEENIGPLNSAASGSEVGGIKDTKTDDIKGSGAEDFKYDEANNVKGDMALSENIAYDSNTDINSAASQGTYKIQERARIFVDGARHNYYIAVGENKYWRHDWNLDGPTLKGQIKSLVIEIPEIEGVDIQLNSMSLNQRPVFAADSHINYFFKNYFQLSYINRYLIPAYIFLILFTVVSFLFGFLPKRTRNSFKTLALLMPLLLLILFSFYFISNYIFTVKGYWDSYKQYIISGRLDETYYGFSDFEKFVTWVGEKVPQGQNVIVLVKGEPVYIMAQMAYGLYPRDIKFIDISSMSVEEIADKITNLNFAESLSENTTESAIAANDNNIAGGKNNTGLNTIDSPQTYEYIVVLSETDKESLKSVKVKLEYSYRENAGFIYKLILK